MRKFISLFLIIFFVLSFCGCNESKTNTSRDRAAVVINQPTDNTVNGYRVSDPVQDSTQMPDTISESDTAVASSENSVTSTADKTAEYCANKNSKVFHTASCSSVKNMKEENKVYSSDRSDLVSQGYTPCGRCKP